MKKYMKPLLYIGITAIGFTQTSFAAQSAWSQEIGQLSKQPIMLAVRVDDRIERRHDAVDNTEDRVDDKQDFREERRDCTGDGADCRSDNRQDKREDTVDRAEDGSMTDRTGVSGLDQATWLSASWPEISRF